MVLDQVPSSSLMAGPRQPGGRRSAEYNRACPIPYTDPAPGGVARSLLHLLLPASCLGLRRAPLLRRPAGPLRPLPRQARPLGRWHACAVCARPLDAFEPPAGYRCGACRERPPAFDRLLALWTYRPPLDAVVQGLKFRRLDYLGRHLARRPGGRAAERRSTGSTGSCPCRSTGGAGSPAGTTRRSGSPAPWPARLGLPLVPALRRARRTPPQTSLGKADRLANLRQAFRVPRPAQVRGLRLLLVDDVATTGATLDAAAAALRRAGRPRITAVVAARTRLRGS